MLDYIRYENRAALDSRSIESPHSCLILEKLIFGRQSEADEHGIEICRCDLLRRNGFVSNCRSHTFFWWSIRLVRIKKRFLSWLFGGHLHKATLPVLTKNEEGNVNFFMLKGVFLRSMRSAERGLDSMRKAVAEERQHVAADGLAVYLQ